MSQGVKRVSYIAAPLPALKLPQASDLQAHDGQRPEAGPVSYIDRPRSLADLTDMGIAISPRGDMPKHRVHAHMEAKGASCRLSTQSRPRNLHA